MVERTQVQQAEPKPESETIFSTFAEAVAELAWAMETANSLMSRVIGPLDKGVYPVSLIDVYELTVEEIANVVRDRASALRGALNYITTRLG